MAAETAFSGTAVAPASGGTRASWLGGRTAFAGIFLLYLVVRLLVWRAAGVVEDHGSISQLYHAKAFVSRDLGQILGLEPDTTPFYPITVALFSLPGWSLETAARLCSLAFSLLLFFAVLQIGRRIAGAPATAAGLLLLSLNPVLAKLAPAILTEPSYIATVYVGLWLFWRQYQRPTPAAAAGLGIVFGLAFLNRIEAVLFLGAIPVFQLLHHLGNRAGAYGRGALVKWALVYAACFAALAAPQIWWVSSRMGQLAINGRQVWSQVMVQEGKSYEEQVYGLDYSPAVINLTYLQAHPEAMKTGRVALRDVPGLYGRLIATNTRDLLGSKLGALLGAAACVLAVLGLGALVVRGRRADALIATGFFAVTLAGPLLHNVVLRHIIVIAPLALLLAGIGAWEGAGWVAARLRVPRVAIAVGALLVVVVGWIAPLRTVLRGAACNREYCAEAIARASRAIRESGLPDSPKIAGRKQYIAYYAGGTPVPLPYTDYDGLVRYLHSNEVTYLYLERAQLGSYPFLTTFDQRAPADFALLDRQVDAAGRVSELYRVRRS
jgi:hypothetical protein